MAQPPGLRNRRNVQKQRCKRNAQENRQETEKNRCCPGTDEKRPGKKRCRGPCIPARHAIRGACTVRRTGIVLQHNQHCSTTSVKDKQAGDQSALQLLCNKREAHWLNAPSFQKRFKNPCLSGIVWNAMTHICACKLVMRQWGPLTHACACDATVGIASVLCTTEQAYARKAYTTGVFIPHSQSPGTQIPAPHLLHHGVLREIAGAPLVPAGGAAPQGHHRVCVDRVMLVVCIESESAARQFKLGF
eukprot:1140511-Pelagomonas_calceolata.AAC.2